MEPNIHKTYRQRVANPYRTLVIIGLSLILASLLLPKSQVTTDGKCDIVATGHDMVASEHAQTVKPQNDTVSCLQPQPCSTPIPATVEQLISDGNRYNRKTVLVRGKGVMLKIRKSGCGEYANYVLIDQDGRFVTVIDYTNKSEPIFRKDECTIKGFYRADIHLIDICEEK